MNNFLLFQFLNKNNRKALIAFIIIFVSILLIPKEMMQAQHGLIDYLPIHSTLEIFAIIVSSLAFTMGWENKSENKYNTTIILACVFLGVAIIDFAHILSYPGMPNFITPSSGNKSIYFWLIGRFAVSFAMVYLVSTSPKLFKSNNTKYYILFLTLIFCGICYWIALFHAEYLPVSFIEGHGLTPFKIYLETCIVFILIIALFIMIFRFDVLEKNYDLNNIFMAICLMIFSEMFFMIFTTHADLYNLIGHIFKAISYFYFYRALFKQSIQKPFDELDSKNQELILAKIRAEEANSAKGQFLANMSHEIRTPLNGILGLTNIIIETNNVDEKGEYIELLRQSEENLLNLVNNILSLSRIEAGVVDVQIIEFNLFKELERNKKLFKILTEKKKLNFNFNIGLLDPEYVKGDLNKLNQVLINIVDNAIKFTEIGSININVSTLKKTESEIEILISIQDSGIGISSEKHDLLFKNFSQIDNSNTRQYGGSGLGLAISKKIVESMNGKIWIESELGQGCTFYFTMKFLIA